MALVTTDNTKVESKNVGLQESNPENAKSSDKEKAQLPISTKIQNTWDHYAAKDPLPMGTTLVHWGRRNSNHATLYLDERALNLLTDNQKRFELRDVYRRNPNATYANSDKLLNLNGDQINELKHIGIYENEIIIKDGKQISEKKQEVSTLVKKLGGLHSQILNIAEKLKPKDLPLKDSQYSWENLAKVEKRISEAAKTFTKGHYNIQVTPSDMQRFEVDKAKFQETISEAQRFIVGLNKSLENNKK